ncbi:MAG: phenylacetic acid degradation-related protein [Firmicutes bacterium]|nr:phenylacetic acid degradation-related protein [Bacillota bacterium]
MQDYVEYLNEKIDVMVERSPFLKLIGIKVTDIQDGVAVGTIQVSADEHTNLYQIAHGGTLASLADTVMGLACATTGKKVVTLDINMNYLGAAVVGDVVTATAKLIHGGKSTMVVECDLTKENRQLIGKARATFFVTGMLGRQW